MAEAMIDLYDLKLENAQAESAGDRRDVQP